MLFLVVGFILAIFGMAEYITTYEPFDNSSAPSLEKSISLMTSTSSFMAFLMMIGGLSFSYSLFYTIINAYKFKEVDLL